ncbi:unnamed protein product [Vicia faba]|uniref:Uncharacterized protein n=1 Tax=Vicia faba TaxID=3906 RepID=A0AAV0ZNJ6_VICFA|nr:unnamed protein product [Vicia faba]
MEDSSNCETVGTVLNQMTTVPKCDLQPLNMDSFSCSDCDVSSEVSMKEGCGSTMSSWASDPESDIYPDLEAENQFVGVENNEDGFLWEMDNRSYEELLKKFIEKEEELRVCNLKLQLSEQEIVGLRVQVENSESQIKDKHEKLELKEFELCEQKEISDKEIFELKTRIRESECQLDDVRGELNLKKGQLDSVRKELNVKSARLFMMQGKLDLDLKNVRLDHVRELNLKNSHLDKMRNELLLKKEQLDNVGKELKLKEAELNEQEELSKEEIFKLKTQIKESENQLKNVREELELKADQLDNVHKELSLKAEKLNEEKEISKEEIFKLKSQITERELQNEDNDINHKEELKKMNSTLLESQVMFSWEREKMDADIARLSKLRKQLTSKLEEFETRNKELEKKVMRQEVEKSNQNKLHSAQVKLLQDEISCLKRELGQRMNDVEAANKESRMIEIKEANIQADKLMAEICTRGDQISHMKKHIDELNTSLKELVVHYRTKVNDEYKLIMRVEELEKEVSKQNVVILERAAEKKEAIWNALESNWSRCSDLFKR